MSVLPPVKNGFPYYFLSAAGLSAVLFFFSTGFYDNWLLTWLAPLPVCLYALQARRLDGAGRVCGLQPWGAELVGLFAAAAFRRFNRAERGRLCRGDAAAAQPGPVRASRVRAGCLCRRLDSV